MFLLPCVSLGVDPRELADQLDIVREAAGLASVEKLAFALGLDESQLRRQLRDEGHVSFSRIVAKLPGIHPRFWSRYGWLLVCRHGVPAEAKRSAWLALSVLGRKQQLKMTAAASSRKRSA